jgi:prepilin-type N-terminal cleavage/methylation domain-containing protein
MRQKDDGFSLIEVLVVTAIIMLMVAILMPVIRAVRNAAYKAVCISNLGQIGLSMGMYAADYHGFYPRHEDQTPYPPGYSWSHWGMKLEPYIDKIGKTSGYKTNELMKCPADNDSVGLPYRESSWAKNSYGYNVYLAMPMGEVGNRVTPRRLPYSVRSDIAVITDGYFIFGVGSTSAIYFRHDTIRRDNYKARGRKDGTVNALFGDLRVENLKDVPGEMIRWDF